MKPYQELTRRGRILRWREVAERALATFGLQGAQYRFNHESGNVSFRVFDRENARATDADLYLSGQYVLRLHQDGYQETDAIRSELIWLDALRRDADLPVPEPIRSMDGELLVEVEHPGIPMPRRCSLLRWVRGRLTERGIAPSHIHAMVRTMALMHEHASAWVMPKGFTRWRYTWDGLYGADNVAGVEAGVVYDRMIDSVRPLFDEATSALREVMGSLGEGPEAFGLIHADISPGSNILFWRGEARPIDFDDCAFGYWMFDIGVGLAPCSTRPDWPGLREAFKTGYESVRALPESQWRFLELFVSAWYAFEIFWAAADAVKVPAWGKASDRWMIRAGEDLARVLRGLPSI